MTHGPIEVVMNPMRLQKDTTVVTVKHLFQTKQLHFQAV